MVAAARPIGVEGILPNPQGDEVLAGDAVRRDLPRRGDVIGRDAVPSTAKARAPRIGAGPPASSAMPSKRGTLRMYVEAGSQANVSPLGAGTPSHSSLPWKTVE